jgi:RNA-binding protein
MQALTGLQKRHLRALGNKLNPVVYIGKSGLSESVLRSIEESLNDHELIKIKYLEFKEERKELNAQIVEKCGCVVAGEVGHTALFFRQNPDEQKQKIKLPVK